MQICKNCTYAYPGTRTYPEQCSVHALILGFHGVVQRQCDAVGKDDNHHQQLEIWVGAQLGAGRGTDKWSSSLKAVATTIQQGCNQLQLGFRVGAELGAGRGEGAQCLMYPIVCIAGGIWGRSHTSA